MNGAHNVVEVIRSLEINMGIASSRFFAFLKRDLI
jgi:hypothetical protein